jgi:hypothetical protein
MNDIQQQILTALAELYAAKQSRARTYSTAPELVDVYANLTKERFIVVYSGLVATLMNQAECLLTELQIMSALEDLAKAGKITLEFDRQKHEINAEPIIRLTSEGLQCLQDKLAAWQCN